MDQIQKNVLAVRRELSGTSAKLVAVSKTYGAAEIMSAYGVEQLDFGESRVQELIEKRALLPQNIRWHFIGHLQRNKVKFIAPFIYLIHSVDSRRLLEEINSCGAAIGRQISCLLQLRLGVEETKFGMSLAEAEAILSDYTSGVFSNIIIEGIMGIGSIAADAHAEVAQAEYAHLAEIFNNLKSRFLPTDRFFKHISMGMSDDYQIAAAAGASLVRIGSKLFGERNYER